MNTTESKSEWKADERSEKALARLEPLTAKLAREHLRLLSVAGLRFKITSGLRTFTEQQALYDQGRTKPGAVVTNAKPGSSWHNFGVAYDLTEFAADNKTPIWESKNYDRAAEIGKSIGLAWGGDWKSFKDRPHFERPLGLSLAQAREKWPTGIIA